MPTEGATNISELDKNNPSSTAPAGEGDDHLRMIKDVLTVSFPALDGLISNSGGDATPGNLDPPDAATFSQLFTDSAANNTARFPVGGIIMWAGLESEIPTGWSLCDGLNGTPDLRSRFVLASGYDAATSQYVVGQSGGNVWVDAGGFAVMQTSNSGDTTVGVDSNADGVTTQVMDRNHGHNYLPSFYALAYIQFKGT
jgi:hypothetical protein